MLLTQQGKLQEAKEAWLQLAAQSPSDYIVQANLQLSDQTDSTVPLPDGKTVETAIVTIRFNLPVYSGSVIRQKDAAVIKADPGSPRTSEAWIKIAMIHLMVRRLA